MTVAPSCEACGDEARFVVHAAGHRIPVCPLCRERALKISAAFDLDATVEPLPPRAELPS